MTSEDVNSKQIALHLVGVLSVLAVLLFALAYGAYKLKDWTAFQLLGYEIFYGLLIYGSGKVITQTKEWMDKNGIRKPDGDK